MTIDNPIRIKADLNGDLRRFTVNSCSIQELCTTIRQIYAQANSSHYVTVRYLDDEGDYVSMSTDEEFKEAVNLANSEILRIQVRLEVHPQVASQPPSIESSTYPLPLCESVSSFSREVPVATSFPAMPVPSAPAVVGNIYPVLNEEPPSACCSVPPMAPASPVVPPFGDKREFKMQMKQQKQEAKRQLREMKRSCHKDNVQQCHELKAEVRATKQKLKEQTRELKQQYRQQKQQMYQQQRQMGGEAHLMARFVKEFFASPSVPIDSENQPQPGMLIAQPGEPFTWFWRFRNDGSVAWPCQSGGGGGGSFEGESNPFNLVGGVQLVPVGRWADHANFQSPAGGLALPMSSVAPGEVVDVALPLRAPAMPGLYRAYWRLATHSGKKFGPRVQVNVLVVANAAGAAAALGGDVALQRGGPAHLGCSSDDDEDLSSSSDDEKGGHVDFVAYLQQLNDMGFGNQKKNMKLLLKHNGNLDAVVACLLKKKDKKAKKQIKKQRC